MQESVGSLTVSMSCDVFRDTLDTRQRSVGLFISQAHACMASAVHLSMMNSHTIWTHPPMPPFHPHLHLHPVPPPLHYLQLLLITAFIITLIMILTRGRV